MFFCEFCKIFKNIFSFDETPLEDCFLCLSVNFEKFFRTLHLYSTPLGNCLFHVQIAEFQPPVTHCLFQQFIACHNRRQSPAIIARNHLQYFQKFFKFCTFLPKFSNILHFAVFLKHLFTLFFLPFSEKAHACPYPANIC